MNEHRREALLMEYGEVASNFRHLSDIRFKLLAFLPIGAVAGAGAALKGENLSQATFVLSLFGLLVTVALAAYNTRNDQLYDELVGRAASIERSLGIPDGNFANRPRAWLQIWEDKPWKIDHRTSVTTIYAASSALWLIGVFAFLLEASRRLYIAAGLPYFEALRHLYVAAGLPYFLTPDAASAIFLLATILSTVCVLLGVKALGAQRKKQANRLRTQAAEAVSKAVGLSMLAVADTPPLLSLCAQLGGKKLATIAARAKYYSQLTPKSLSHYIQSGSPLVVAAHTIALLTDLPARWLFDTVTNRTGAL